MAAPKKRNKKLHKVLAIDFNRAQDENERKKTRTIYKKQCKKLIQKENQESLIKVLTIGRLEKIPLLLLLVDCYTRDRFDEYIRIASKQNEHNNNDPNYDEFINDHTLLTVSTWTKQFIKKVSHKNKSIIPMAQDIEASINACFKRYAGKFFFNQSVLIKDDRLRFANYALAGAYFVDRLVERERAIPPFQIDFMILPRETRTVLRDKPKRQKYHHHDTGKPALEIKHSYTTPATLQPMSPISDDGDLDNKNDDTDDDDDDDTHPYGAMKRNESKSDVVNNGKKGLMFIQNLSGQKSKKSKSSSKKDVHKDKGSNLYTIEKRLKNKGCDYAIDIEKDGISNQPNRLFYQFYSGEFSNKMNKKYDKSKSHTDKLKYPHRKRMAVVIDRWRDVNKIKDRLEGKDNDEEKKEDDLKPPSPSKKQRSPKKSPKKELPSRRNPSLISTGSTASNRSRRSSSGMSKKRKKKDKPDTIYMFEPEKNNEFPKNFVSEWGLDAAFTSIIPSWGDKKKPSPEKRSVGASDTGEGYVFVLSFQVYSKNEIRCYCCFGGQMFRFLPKDITTTWMHIFDEDPFTEMSRSTRKKDTKYYAHREQELKKTELDLSKLMDKWDPGFDKFRQLAKYNPDDD